MHHQASALAVAAAALLAGGCASPLGGSDLALERQTARVERELADEWRLDSSNLAAGTQPVASAAPAPPALDADSTLDDYVIHAALNNPRLEAAFAHWKAALERLPQVRALPDPRFTYGYFINEVETRVGPQQHRFAVTQMFPWFGKLQLQEDIAAKEAEAAYEQYLAVRLEVIHAVRDAWYDRAGLEREIQIMGENIELLNRLVDVALDRLRVGTTRHPDVIRLQIELEKLQDQARTLGDRRRPIDARLNATLNRPAETPVEGSFVLPEEAIQSETAAIVGRLPESSPTLRAADRRIEAGRLATRLARTAEQPDLTLGLDLIATDDAINSAMNESGDDPLIASISFNVPIWREKYDAGVREAISRRYANMRSRADLERELAAQVEQALFDYRTAQRQIVLYRDNLLPKAQQALDATLGAYQSGTSSFLDLLQAQRELLEFELMHVHALTRRARHLAHLDRLVGIDLPRTTAAPGENQP